jgi:hypothetical protein
MGVDRAACGPFRAVLNAGDIKGRKNYSCGGPNPIQSRPGIPGKLGDGVPSKCDGSAIAAANCNPKFVYDSSDYVKFKRQRSKNKNYNDSTTGGYNNSAYSAIMKVRR